MNWGHEGKVQVVEVEICATSSKNTSIHGIETTMAEWGSDLLRRASRMTSAGGKSLAGGSGGRGRMLYQTREQEADRVT